MTLAACLVSLFIFSQNEKIDSLTVQLAYQSQDSVKVDTSLRLIKELYKVKDYKKALLYINQTSRLSKSLNYKIGLAETSYYRALIYTERNDYYNAIDNYKKSKKYFSKINDTLGIAKVSNSIGLIEIKRGNYAVGLKNSLSAIDILEKRNLKSELSTAYNNLAEAYYKTNQIDKALDFNLKALEIRKTLNDSVGIKESTKNIAEFYSLRKEHRKAIEYYENVLEILNPKTDKDLRGEILPKLGSEYLSFKEYDKATNYLVEGLKYNREQGNKEGVLRALNAIGNLNLKNKKIDIAQEQLDEAYEIAKNIDNKNELLENYRLHISLDSINENYKDAFLWQNKYYNLRDEISKLNQPIITNNIEIIEELEKTPLLDNTSDSAKTNSSEKKLWINNANILYGAFAFFVVLVGLVLFNFFNTKKYKTTIIDQKNKLTQVQIKNEAIIEQSLHLEEVNQVKDKLFSIVSHDLKDSISSVKAFLDLLKDNSITKEEFEQLIPELSENADNASSLLFNLLNWSKSQLQNLEPRPELFNIQKVFDIKIQLVEQKIEDKGIVLINKSQRGLVYADRSMIEIVVQNLITNAVKFSESGDVITISNQVLNNRVIICVEDTGVGISEENIKKLFKANKNFTTTGTKNEKGTGLGLMIARDLIELNNGKIWVESKIGIGSKFFVELPKYAVEN